VAGHPRTVLDGDDGCVLGDHAVELKTPQDTLTLDPIAMNVVSRVAAGSHLNGEHFFEGGLLVQGEI
jgi:hypothetical protein